MARHAGTDNDLLSMALVGYEAQRAKIDTAIAEIQAKLGRAPGTPTQSAPKKHRMSAAARKRIAAAQRKRWAAVKKSQAQGKSAATAAAPKKKSKMSAAGRKAIIEATRKRWAAYRKAGGKKAKPVVKASKAAAS
jgi:hypothetical protein